MTPFTSPKNGSQFHGHHVTSMTSDLRPKSPADLKASATSSKASKAPWWIPMDFAGWSHLWGWKRWGFGCHEVEKLENGPKYVNYAYWLCVSFIFWYVVYMYKWMVHTDLYMHQNRTGGLKTYIESPKKINENWLILGLKTFLSEPLNWVNPATWQPPVQRD